MSVWSHTVVKPVKTFWERDQTPESFLTLGPKMAKKFGLWSPYFTHFWKKLQCAYKARLMWIQTKFFNKIFNNLNFVSFGGPKWPKIWASGASYLHTYKSSPSELVNQVSSEYSRNVSRKPIYWLILALFGARKVGPRGPFFTHKNVLRKWPKTFKIPIFTYFSYKRSIKTRSNKKKILLPHLLGQYCCAHSRQISEWSMKTEGAYWIWKKKLMDAGWLGIG